MTKQGEGKKEYEGSEATLKKNERIECNVGRK